MLREETYSYRIVAMSGVVSVQCNVGALLLCVCVCFFFFFLGGGGQGVSATVYTKEN